MTRARNAYVLSLIFLLWPLVSLAASAPVELTETIQLPSVKGRIDHFSFDVKHRRLFVAALGNDTVEVVDLKGARRERSLAGFGEPQGVLYLPEFDRLYVASGSGNRLDILDGSSLSRVKSVAGLDDADNVRYDAKARKVYVGYGKGSLRVLDAATGDSAGDIRLSGHPESFQMEARGQRIFVNVPTARHVAVVDRTKAAVIATWPVPDAAANYPMALDEAGRRLFVGARKPAVVLVYDIDTGKVVGRQPIGGDVDDLFFDSARKRLYAVCGEGRIDVVRQEGPDRYSLQGTIQTSPRARTGLLVPEEARLFVAAPARGASPAKVLAYRID